ncbi:Os06g0142900 [Oryza sativa Japonica Group]|uniref:Os06g0142900 protein n=1 Tax=Oryza sativa subsp. japonica TaxID=39947 RepID=A0A0P0WSV0_ORYSJ|nr:hypothetical protein EE612_031872 [Oryza sativa]BAS96107.1 Os06g0142900 [Oryza sativa Japonica Group]
MGGRYLHSPPAVNLICEESTFVRSTSCCLHSCLCLRCKTSNLKPCRTLVFNMPSRRFNRRVAALPDVDDFFWEKDPTPILDTIDAPIHLKNLSSKTGVKATSW